MLQTPRGRAPTHEVLGPQPVGPAPEGQPPTRPAALKPPPGPPPPDRRCWAPRLTWAWGRPPEARLPGLRSVAPPPLRRRACGLPAPERAPSVLPQPVGRRRPGFPSGVRFFCLRPGFRSGPVWCRRRGFLSRVGSPSGPGFLSLPGFVPQAAFSSRAQVFCHRLVFHLCPVFHLKPIPVSAWFSIWSRFSSWVGACHSLSACCPKSGPHGPHRTLTVEKVPKGRGQCQGVLLKDAPKPQLWASLLLCCTCTVWKRNPHTKAGCGHTVTVLSKHTYLTEK